MATKIDKKIFGVQFFAFKCLATKLLVIASVFKKSSHSSRLKDRQSFYNCKMTKKVNKTKNFYFLFELQLYDLR
jgi:hypothetical protein